MTVPYLPRVAAKGIWAEIPPSVSDPFVTGVDISYGIPAAPFGWRDVNKQGKRKNGNIPLTPKILGGFL